MRIEAVEQTRSPQKKLRLRFSDGSTLLLMPSVFADHALRVGDELTEQSFAALCADAARAGTRERAVRIISASAVSSAELRHRLVAKGESEQDAQDAVEWLKELKLLDDSRVAQQIVRNGVQKGYGEARIRQMLFEKRIPKALWEEAIAAVPPREDAIDDFLRRRFAGTTPDRAACKKAADALMRRGHSWQEIREALSRYAPEDE